MLGRCKSVRRLQLAAAVSGGTRFRLTFLLDRDAQEGNECWEGDWCFSAVRHGVWLCCILTFRAEIGLHALERRPGRLTQASRSGILSSGIALEVDQVLHGGVVSYYSMTVILLGVDGIRAGDETVFFIQDIGRALKGLHDRCTLRKVVEEALASNYITQRMFAPHNLLELLQPRWVLPFAE